MMTAEARRLSAWLDTLPTPRDESKWDSIFLVPPRQLGYDILLAWYYRTFIHPEGELHHEWKDPRGQEGC